MGVDGGIGITCNVMGWLFVDICDAMLRGDLARARVLQNCAKAGIDVLVLVDVGGLAGTTVPLKLPDRDAGPCRQPLADGATHTAGPGMLPVGYWSASSMSCQPGSAMNPSDAFSQNYAEARAKFRTTAAAAGARLTAIHHPLLGPAGETLACDVARFGADDAQAVLWINSATHGVEGYCGSGVQIAMMALGWPRRLPAGVALLMTHAINPHGFAWTRRVTEDNVDLNRNFGPPGVASPVNAGYAQIHQWVIPQAIDGPERAAADAALEQFRVQHGDRALHQAMAGGQYAYPDGLFYGGTGPTWSNRTLHSLIGSELAGARRFCFFDIHTGLGPAGYGEASYVGKPTEEAFAECQRWLGDDVTWLERGTGQSTPLHGHIGLPFRPLYDAGKSGPVIGIEFGTVPSPEVRAALRADHWLHARGQLDSAQGRAIKRRLRDVFYVDTDSWKQQVIDRADELVTRAMRNLAA